MDKLLLIMRQEELENLTIIVNVILLLGDWWSKLCIS